MVLGINRIEYLILYNYKCCFILLENKLLWWINNVCFIFDFKF